MPHHNDDHVVDTKCGKVRGIRLETTSGTEFISFWGIPYAKEPLGDLRFKDPVPMEPWIDTYLCKYKPACPQRTTMFKKIRGDEDCLSINVYTKQVETGCSLVPVMVYIHGGDFCKGSGSADRHGPDYLIEKNLVIVTFNYRVGPFGFSSFSDPTLEVPGNAGLKDQVMALNWVKTNISAFGGDADNITLFGSGVGACCVHMHMLSPMSKGLFHKAILQSGTAYNDWSVSENRTYRLSKEVGWDGEGGDQSAFRFLNKASAVELVKAHEKILTPEDEKKYVIYSMGPVIESYRGEQCFLPAAPEELALGGRPGWGWGVKLPVITGFNADEGLMLYSKTMENPAIIAGLGDFEEVLPQALDLTKDSALSKQLGRKLKHFYFGDAEPSLESRDKYFMMLTDKLVVHGTHRFIRRHLGPLYVYRFAVDSADNNISRIVLCGKDVQGVCHSDDLAYIFKTTKSMTFEPDTLEARSIALMTRLWSNFALTSDPNKPHKDEPKWKPYNKDKEYYLNISQDVTLQEGVETERMAFWDHLYKTVGKE